MKAESTQNRSRVMPNNKNITQTKKPYQSLNLSPEYDQFDPTLTYHSEFDNYSDDYNQKMGMAWMNAPSSNNSSYSGVAKKLNGNSAPKQTLLGRMGENARNVMIEQDIASHMLLKNGTEIINDHLIHSTALGIGDMMALSPRDTSHFNALEKVGYYGVGYPIGATALMTGEVFVEADLTLERVAKPFMKPLLGWSSKAVDKLSESLSGVLGRKGRRKHSNNFIQNRLRKWLMS